jgi:hypothetical protein
MNLDHQPLFAGSGGFLTGGSAGERAGVISPV